MLLFALLACGDAVEDSGFTPLARPQAILRTDPQQLDFGAVALGETARFELALINEGSADLHLLDLELLGDEAFELGAPDAVIVPPDQVTNLRLEFTPTTTVMKTATLSIQSDGEPSLLQVGLSGRGSGPDLHVDEAFELGTLELGCGALESLSLANIGTEPLTIDSLALDGELFRAEPEPALPWTLTAGEERGLDLHFDPSEAGDFEAELLIHSDDPLQPEASVALSARAQIEHEATEVFEIPSKQPVDILVAVDWSSSMVARISQLLGEAEVLLDTLDEGGLDWHLGFVTEDDGCLRNAPGQGPWIDHEDERSEQLDNLTNMICGSADGSSCASGTGSNTERAFMLFEAALRSSSTSSGGCNEGLYREDARLALVGFSDEPEQSVNAYTYYVSLFQSMKADADDTVIHGIGGDYPSGCGTAMAYTGLYEATLATGGEYLSICDDMDLTLEALAQGIAGSIHTGAFVLEQQPVPSTLEVSVDGILSSAWSYDAVDNAVLFEAESKPGPSSTVQVEYAIQPACE